MAQKLGQMTEALIGLCLCGWRQEQPRFPIDAQLCYLQQAAASACSLSLSLCLTHISTLTHKLTSIYTKARTLSFSLPNLTAMSALICLCLQLRVYCLHPIALSFSYLSNRLVLFCWCRDETLLYREWETQCWPLKGDAVLWFIGGPGETCSPNSHSHSGIPSKS